MPGYSSIQARGIQNLKGEEAILISLGQMHHEATRLPGKHVYTHNGTYLGTVQEVGLDLTTHRVDGLYLTQTSGSLVPEAANIIIPYRWVANMDDIIILRFFPAGLSFVETEAEPEVMVAALSDDESLESLEFELEPMGPDQEVMEAEAVQVEVAQPQQPEDWPEE